MSYNKFSSRNTSFSWGRSYTIIQIKIIFKKNTPQNKKASPLPLNHLGSSMIASTSTKLLRLSNFRFFKCMTVGTCAQSHRQTHTHEYKKKATSKTGKIMLINYCNTSLLLGFPGDPTGKESSCQCRRYKRCRLSPWVRKVPWKRKCQPTPGFLPGESHGQRSLVGYHP